MAPSPNHPIRRVRRGLLAAALALGTLAGSTALGSSPAAAGTPPFCETDEVILFVCRSFYSFPRRTPGESEAQGWASQLPGKKAAFLSAIAKSEESIHRIIEAYYDYFAEVEVDEGGMAYWETRVLQPRGFRKLEAALLATHADAGTYVAYLYGDLIGRQPTPSEVEYWEDRVTAKGKSQVAADIAFTVEARNIRVRFAYRNELGHFPDTAGRDYWAGRLRAGLSYLDLRIALKSAGYPTSSGVCSTSAPFLGDFC